MCAMYSQSWNPSVYATNDGQWDGAGNHITISSSVFSSSYSAPVCPSDIDDLRNCTAAAAFCTGYIEYTPPATVTQTVTSGVVTMEECVATDSGVKLSRRDRGEVEIGDAVVAIFPSKVDDLAITGNTPAVATIAAAHLSEPGAYAVASAQALDQLLTQTNKTDPSSPHSHATSHAALQMRAASTPKPFLDQDPRDISSACTRLLTTSTPIITLNLPSATSTTTLNPPQCTSPCSPRQLIAGSFTNAPTSIDDAFYQLTLPFEVCIYTSCSNIVRPTINGVITLGGYATLLNNNELLGPLPIGLFAPNAVLYPFFDDLFIKKGEAHYMAVQVCGAEGKRRVEMEWSVGHFAGGPGADYGRGYFGFSVTFSESQPGRVVVRYGNITDSGQFATVGVQGPGAVDGVCLLVGDGGETVLIRV